MALINCSECTREISDKAGACPHCGHPVEKQISVNAFPHQNAKSCPACKSENTQSIKMMCLNGTTTGAAFAVGANTHLDIGVASINSKAETKLVSQYSPGEKPTNNVGCLSVLCYVPTAIFVYNGLYDLIHKDYSSGLLILSLTVFIAPIPAFIKYMNKEKTEKLQSDWEQKNLLYNSGWICHKCGRTWVPDNQDNLLKIEESISKMMGTI